MTSDTPTPEPKVLFGPAKLKHKWHDDTDYVSDPVMEGDGQWVGRFKCDAGCEVKSTNSLDPLHHAMLARIAELERRPTEKPQLGPDDLDTIEALAIVQGVKPCTDTSALLSDLPFPDDLKAEVRNAHGEITEADLLAVAERAATLNITLGGPHASERAAAQAVSEWREARTK